MSDVESGGGGAFDPQALMEQALQMQQQLEAARAEAEAETVEGSAGGGKVNVTMTGGGDVTAVRIDPSVVVADDVEMLEDLVMAAMHDASTKATALARSKMGGLGDLLGGLGA
jgi:hypothetical protein